MASYRKEKNMIYLEFNMPFSNTIVRWSINLDTSDIIDMITGEVQDKIPTVITSTFLRSSDSIENLTKSDRSRLEHIFYVINRYSYLGAENQVKIFNVIDRVYNVGLECTYTHEFVTYITDEIQDIQFNKTFVDFVKEFNDGEFSCFSIKAFTLNKLKRKYNLTNDQLRAIVNLADDIKEDKYIEYASVLYGLRNVEYIESAYDYIRRYYFYNREMGREWVASKHFFDDYCKLQKEYTIFCDLKKNEALAKKDGSSYLFSDDKYTVIVPQTTKEFEDEANQQSNCVYRLYLDRVIDGDCTIVFIRDKNKINKSLITCEINNKRGIEQFLAKNNDDDIPFDLIVFKQKYQQFLNPHYDEDDEYDDDDNDDDED